MICAKYTFQGLNIQNIPKPKPCSPYTFATQVYGKTKDLLLVQRSRSICLRQTAQCLASLRRSSSTRDRDCHANPRTTAKYAHVNNDLAAAKVIDLG